MAENDYMRLLPEDSYGMEETRPGVRVHEEGLKAAQTINEILWRAGEIDEGPAALPPAELLRRIVPADGENYRSIGHCLMVGRFAKRFAEHLGLDADLAERAGVFHDAGRWANVHRYFRNDVVGTLILKRLGLHAQVESVLQPQDSFVLPDQYKSIESLTLQQGVTVLADICGRPTDTGDIAPFESTMDRHFKTRVPGTFETPWPSERAARSVLTDDVVQQWGNLYVALRDWMKESGLNIEAVRQEFLAKDAASPIDTMIFDVGGVLIGDTDPPVVKDFCNTLSITEDELNAAWGDIVGQLQTGAITEDQFWDQFGEKLGKRIPQSQRDLFTRSFNPTMDPRMKDILKRLKDSGKKLLVLSDTIPQHVRALERAGVYEGFDEVLTSPGIHASKKAGSALQKNSELAAFCIAALHAGRPPQSCLFIDDRQKYVEMAQSAKMHAVPFTTIEQLEANLREAGL